MSTVVHRHPRTAALLGYIALAGAATWPLLPRFTSEIGGDHGDAWQTLWGFWWWRDAVARGASPFHCDVLRWPWGTPTWFQTWNLPATLAVLPLWPLTPGVPEVALYNLVLFASYVLSGYTAYLLCRELWGTELAAFLAGALYTVNAYHFGHALGHLHIVSMEWAPLYFLGLVRTVRRHGASGPLLGGVALALAATASFYYLLFCAIGTIVLLLAWLRFDRDEVAAWLRSDRAELASGAFLRRAGLLAGTFLVLAGWLYAGMLRAYRAEPYAGAHDATWFSADLLSFFVPNAASAWRGSFQVWRHFTGNDAESTAYVGYVALALALAAFARAKASRPWLAVALVGFVLALGPRLHVGGRALAGPSLPYAWLERAVPLLRFAGVPTRFSWLVTFGVSVAAGASLAELVRTGRRGALLACAVAALALAESWPHPFVTSTWPAPKFMRDLARDGERWAVLDATGPTRQLWHQVLHRHPQVGGYMTRAPERLERLLAETPVFRPFFGDGGALPPRGEAVRALQLMNVRFVVVDRGKLAAAKALRVPLAYEGDGIFVFEIPPRVG
ncbi:MAG TPA: hypothetical protein VF904_12740 [Anaeromyxobacteraceae bacterium]